MKYTFRQMLILCFASGKKWRQCNNDAKSLAWKTKKGREKDTGLVLDQFEILSDMPELLIKHLIQKPEFKRKSKSVNYYVVVIKPRNSKRLPRERI